MKQIITFLVIVTMAFAGCKTSETGEKTTIGLLTPFFHVPQQFNGQIKSMTVKGYWANVEGDKVKAGDLLTGEELDSLNLISHFTINFDESGNVQGYSFLDDNENPFLTYRFEHIDGKPSKGSYIEEDGLDFRQKMEYDSIGNLVKISSYITDSDTLINCRQLVYGDDGKYTRISIFNEHRELNRYIDYTWNDKGNIIRVENYANSGEFTGGIDNNYFDDGFLKSQSLINKERQQTALQEFRIEKKDKVGNPVFVVNLLDGVVVFVDKYQYTYH